ncbi:MAG: hypothetical protein MJE77_46795 [Proteobacteria bacterium]|nr:hypothetical protein [Pseudomonadota bacterium]
MREAEKIEGFRFPVATPPPILRRKAAELQQAGLVRAAKILDVAPSTVHRWLNDGFIAGEQLTPGAP